MALLTASTIIADAVGQINKEGVYPSTVLTAAFSLQQLDAFQGEVLSEQKRWGFMQSFDTVLGDTATGNWRVAVPTDLDDQYTNRGIWNFRIGTQSNLTFVDKAKWDEITSQVAHTTLKVAIVVGDAIVTLTDSSDFADSGVILVGANEYTYTANDRTTGILTLSAVTTTTNLILASVFQNASMGAPIYWTIFNGYIDHWPLISSQYDKRNYYLDYYKAQTALASASSVLVVPDPAAASYYLQWKMLKKLNNGQETAESAAAKANYINAAEKLKQKDSLGRVFRLKPRKNSINVSGGYSDSKSDRLRGWEV